MKQITFLSLLIVSSIATLAQDGFSLSVSYGTGFGYERKETPADPRYSYDYYPWSFSHGTCSKADLNISYTSGHWVVQTGIGYWKDGYTRSAHHYYIISFSSPLPGPPEYALLKQTFYYPHIVVPVSLGYRLHLTKKLSLTPYIGAAVANNKSSSVIYQADASVYHRHLSKGDFRKGYLPTSWWATAHIELSYVIASRWSIFAGPHFAYMLTNMVKNDYWTIESSSFRLYNITLDAGLSWRLKKERGARAPLSR